MLLFKIISKMLIVNSISIFLSNVNLLLAVLTNLVMLLIAVLKWSNEYKKNKQQDNEISSKSFNRNK